MKVSKLLIVLSLLCSTLLAADNNTTQTNSPKLEKYISDNKQEQFLYDYQKNEAEGSKLRNSWIAPLNLQYSNSKSNPYVDVLTNETAAIRMDQPIFQSGGIYYGIKFAEASQKYANYSTDVVKRKLVKDAVALLMQIKQIELKIQKQNLQIKNAEINLRLKKEQYLSGQLDSGFLDNAILERNVAVQALYDIETNNEKLISQFQALSDISYKNAQIPHLELLNEKEFLEDNIVLNMSQSEIEKNRYYKNATLTKYLPKVSVTGGYNWNKSDSPFQFGSQEKDYYDYGVKASLPLDINSFQDIESSKIDYLKSQVVAEDKKRQLRALFEQVMQNVSNLEKKKQLSIENKDIYAKLLTDTKNLFQAGYKTSYDVELLSNSLSMQDLDVKIFEIDRQLELLSLYEMYKNEI